MSDKPYLTKENMLEIAEPRTQPAAIVRWFRANGFPDCPIRPNGFPDISVAEYEAQRSQKRTESSTSSTEKPDVAGFLKKIADRSKNKAPA